MTALQEEGSELNFHVDGKIDVRDQQQETVGDGSQWEPETLRDEELG